ncbi:MAG: phosphatidylserine decarboxylase [Alphaproteobacteria bacterium]|nr:MAG: phosphatidylserine decarboxylase [Alphaproteobacteria bacterium]
MHRRRMIQTSLALAVSGCATGPIGDSGGGDPFERAFYYAFPLYEFARIQQDRTGAIDGQPGRLNTIVHRAQLLDHTSRLVTAPNNDTIYSSSFLELSRGPVEIEAPSSSERYFSIAFMQAFTDVFAYIGTRATGGEGGRYWIVGPQWTGEGAEGVRIIRSPTNDVWMLMRTLVDGPSDLAVAHAFQQRLTLTLPPGRAGARGYAVTARDVNDPANFLALANEVIARSPGGADQLARAPGFAAQGVGVSNPPSPEVLERFREVIPAALETLRDVFRFRDYAVDGWSYQPPGIGDFGDNDRLRAAVALGGIAALGEEEAMYFHANFDAAGERLNGAARYRWRVPAGGVPVDGFWSLTMYTVTPEGRYFLVDNPIQRYSIGDRTQGLVVDADGGIEIWIQRERPEGAMAANWLPAPEGPMRLALRAYLPKPQLRSRSWRVPALRRVI